MNSVSCSKRYCGILDAVGGTPLVELHKLCPGFSGHIYAKLEGFNPAGSLKDRTALQVVRDAIDSGDLTAGAEVIESSSGNMAIGLAQACKFYGFPLTVVVDPKVNSQNVRILQTFGATIVCVDEPAESGGYLEARLQKVRQLVDDNPDAFWPNQYENPSNPKAHHQTMREIVDAVDEPLDYLLVATSTCGTVMGCADYVRGRQLATQIVAVDACGSVLFGDEPGDRLIPGHGASRPSRLLREDAVDQVVHVSDRECVIGCRRLLDREAIFAGGSSGGVVSAAKKFVGSIPPDASMALLLADRGDRYLDTVYSERWVRTHLGEVVDPDRRPPDQRAAHSPAFAPGPSNPRRVAIVGGGPKGTYALERLVAELADQPPGGRVEIDVFNRTAHFGAGQTYGPQPDYWLMNYAAGHIDMWTDTGPDAVVEDTQNFVDWAQSAGWDVSETDFCPRSRVGRYLADGFARICANAPPSVEVRRVVGEVVDIGAPCGGGRRVDTREQSFGPYGHVLLATGHPRPDCRADGQTVPFIYPVSTLDPVEAGSTVAIRGLGLTFIDAVLALTEGRGGVFDRQADRLQYGPSGAEPAKLFGFSRSGMPMWPRGPAVGQRPDAQPLDGLSSWADQIWPVVCDAMQQAYYRTRHRREGKPFESLADFRDRVASFSPREFLWTSVDRNHPHEYVCDYIDRAISHAERGSGGGGSGLAAASAVWRRFLPSFQKLYAFGGLDADDQRLFDQEYHRRLARVSFGPPIINLQKIAALAEAGLVSFECAPGAVETRRDASAGMRLRYANKAAAIDWIVDARIPSVSHDDPGSRADRLYQHLLERGAVRVFVNRTGGSTYVPGCIEIDRQGRVVTAQGQASSWLSATGAPTEGITYDNDSLSRSCNDLASPWARRVAASLA